MTRRKLGETGRASEKHLARALGARLTPASGAGRGGKGDMTLGRHLLEAKSSTGDSVRLQRGWLAKIAGEARAAGRQPGLTITFTYQDGRPIPDGSWVCIPLRQWRELIEDATP